MLVAILITSQQTIVAQTCGNRQLDPRMSDFLQRIGSKDLSPALNKVSIFVAIFIYIYSIRNSFFSVFTNHIKSLAS